MSACPYCESTRLELKQTLQLLQEVSKQRDEIMALLDKVSNQRDKILELAKRAVESRKPT